MRAVAGPTAADLPSTAPCCRRQDPRRPRAWHAASDPRPPPQQQRGRHHPGRIAPHPVGTQAVRRGNALCLRRVAVSRPLRSERGHADNSRLERHQSP
eukprot:3601518-Rhodomonas_salina.6